MVRLLPALLAAICVATFALVVSAPLGQTAVGDCTAGTGFRPANAALADEVVRLVNQHRAGLGLKALKVSPALTVSATWKARHMATYGYMAHEDPAPPVARTAADRIAACGYRFAGWGENIAAGFPTAAAVLAGWLQSPGHRANIENPAYVVTGSGASVAASGVVLWAQDFGMTDDSGAAAPPKPTAPIGDRIILRQLQVARSTARFTMHAHALLAPSMRPLRNGSTGCSASLGHARLHVVARRFAHGSVACAWRVPPRAAAGRIEATIFVAAAAESPAHATVAVASR